MELGFEMAEDAVVSLEMVWIIIRARREPVPLEIDLVSSNWVKTLRWTVEKRDLLAVQVCHDKVSYKCVIKA